MKYFCNNCSKDFEIYKVTLSFDKEGNEIVLSNGVELKCPHCCSSDFKFKMEKDSFDVNYLKFKALPMSDKRAMLQKRSNDHFKKEIKEAKMLQDKGAK